MKKFFHFESINRIAIVLLILGIGSGLFITAQWRTKTLRVSDPVAPYVELTDTKGILTIQQIDYKKQISALQKQIKTDQEKLKSQNLSKNIVEQVEQYKDLIGLTEKNGSGVTIILDDAKNSIADVNSITHAADLRDSINFLWSIGADSIGINGERIVLNTSIDCIVNTVLINSTKTTAPFKISVIGDSNKLQSELNNQNNLKDIHKRVKSEGLIFNVETSRKITIPAFNGSLPIKYSKILGS